MRPFYEQYEPEPHHESDNVSEDSIILRGMTLTMNSIWIPTRTMKMALAAFISLTNFNNSALNHGGCVCGGAALHLHVYVLGSVSFAFFLSTQLTHSRSIFFHISCCSFLQTSLSSVCLSSNLLYLCHRRDMRWIEMRRMGR
ncbi:Protein of unknown function [Pyronema omphalodes CBS 100304]|uniref:Uncharacterized protein n=1 Tax=Pyronema omphalodes (strain CBS 100304) TaxID=1076935 RepID=U4L327_PYROM|nr:Protein of unknown function [Pyronema omphalodes CBS 100304]